MDKIIEGCTTSEGEQLCVLITDCLIVADDEYSEIEVFWDEFEGRVQNGGNV